MKVLYREDLPCFRCKKPYYFFHVEYDNGDTGARCLKCGMHACKKAFSFIELEPMPKFKNRIEKNECFIKLMIIL